MSLSADLREQVRQRADCACESGTAGITTGSARFN